MVRLLRHEELAGLLSPEEIMAAVRAGLEEQGRGLVQVPPRLTLDSAAGHGWLRLMPAILNGSGYMGYKAMHSTPGVGVRYLVLLYDLREGTLLAILDADWLTVQRTAATAAVAVDLLARPEAETVGLLGSSEQARALLRAVARVRRLRRGRVFSPTPAHRERFAAELGAELGLALEPVADPETAVRDAALVLSAIRAGREPVLRAEWLAPGCHVTAISAVRPEARELDDGVWRRSAVVVVDDRAHAFESGDGRSALASGSLRAEAAAELWEVACGRRPGRGDPQQVTLFKSVGTALQDLCVAAALYQRALERGLGQELGEFPHLRR
ncbi:MAG TPA: ornithine cyclodeaminase family protein [Chloroflexota bacterium]|nr:ornithine cyclodeaminase family protein [Chloroflexota bacterium]